MEKIDNLKKSARTIKTNELPQSNTALLIGSHLEGVNDVLEELENDTRDVASKQEVKNLIEQSETERQRIFEQNEAQRQEIPQKVAILEREVKEIQDSGVGSNTNFKTIKVSKSDTVVTNTSSITKEEAFTNADIKISVTPSRYVIIGADKDFSAYCNGVRVPMNYIGKSGDLFYYCSDEKFLSGIAFINLRTEVYQQGEIVIEKVDTPSIAIDGNKVTISCLTDGAVIRYTTDGTTPSKTNGSVYSGVVSLNDSCVVKAIAYKDDMDDSDIATAEYEKPDTKGVTYGIGSVNGALTEDETLAITDYIEVTAGHAICFDCGTISSNRIAFNMYDENEEYINYYNANERFRVVTPNIPSLKYVRLTALADKIDTRVVIDVTDNRILWSGKDYDGCFDGCTFGKSQSKNAIKDSTTTFLTPKLDIPSNCNAITGTWPLTSSYSLDLYKEDGVYGDYYSQTPSPRTITSENIGVMYKKCRACFTIKSMLENTLHDDVNNQMLWSYNLG